MRSQLYSGLLVAIVTTGTCRGASSFSDDGTDVGNSYPIEKLIDNGTIAVLDQHVRDLAYAHENDGRAIEGDACKIKPTCEIAGGHCVTNADNCRYGRLVAKGCNGNLCQCCIPGCPVKDGFFMMYNQCFKFFDIASTWYEAKNICETEGLLLARPYQTLELRNYLVQRYGVANSTSYQDKHHRVQVWLDAQSDGDCVRWNRGTAGCISPYLPLWQFETDPNVDVGNCLLLTSTAYSWGKRPEKTLHAAVCTDYKLYPLCELLQE